MSPKFRGDANDWIDDPDGNKSVRGNKKSAKAKAFVDKVDAIATPWESANAIVAEVHPNLCTVNLIEDPLRRVLCSFRRAGVIQKDAAGEMRGRSPFSVGDRVVISMTDSSHGVITALCARRNALSRPAPGKQERKLDHVIATNIDILVIVASAQEPAFSSGVVDRFIIAAEFAGIQPILVVSKVDLSSETPAPWQVYADLGYRVIEASVRSGAGVKELAVLLANKEVAFCGHSGVGKTTLLRSLLGTDLGKVGAVSTFTGKGKHTTSSAVRYQVPSSQESGWSGWIDTPGIREFGLVQIEPQSLREYFPEFRDLDCQENGCLHLEEPTCGAKSLPRYMGYRRIYLSLVEET